MIVLASDYVKLIIVNRDTKHIVFNVKHKFGAAYYMSFIVRILKMCLIFEWVNSRQAQVDLGKCVSIWSMGCHYFITIGRG